MNTINIEELKTAVKTWDENRDNPEKVIAYLNTGNCFQITRSDYNTWLELTTKPEYIHAYVGLFTSTLKFILVDSVTDAQLTLDTSYMFVKDYLEGVPPTESGPLGSEPDITVPEALERCFRWNMLKGPWVLQQKRIGNEMFQAFHIPFSDLEKLFEDSTKNELYAVFGLKSDGIAELILWNNVFSFSGKAIVEDVALPVPPFGPAQSLEGYQLLVQSIG